MKFLPELSAIPHSLHTDTYSSYEPLDFSLPIPQFRILTHFTNVAIPMNLQVPLHSRYHITLLLHWLSFFVFLGPFWVLFFILCNWSWVWGLLIGLISTNFMTWFRLGFDVHAWYAEYVQPKEEPKKDPRIDWHIMNSIQEVP